MLFHLNILHIKFGFISYCAIQRRTFFETSIDRIRSFPPKISHKKSCSLAEKKSLTQLRSVPGLK